MQKAHLNLIKYALDNDYRITVWYDEEGEDLNNSTSYNEIKAAVEACSIMYMRIVGRGGQNLGVAMVVNDSTFDPEEYVADYSCTPFMEDWAAQYYEEN